MMKYKDDYTEKMAPSNSQIMRFYGILNYIEQIGDQYKIENEALENRTFWQKVIDKIKNKKSTDYSYYIRNANEISEMIKKNITNRMDNAYYEYFHNLVSGLIDPIMRQFCFEYTMTLTRSKIILNAIINKDLFNLHQYQFVSNITSSYLIFDNKEEESNNEQ